MQRSRAGTAEPAVVRSGVSETADEDVLDVPVPVAGAEQRQSIRVLHVDDDPEVTAVTAEYLEHVGEDFEVLSETGVVAALDRLGETEIDCVVSDYDMPNTDGLEFLEIVRDRWPDLPFILFTGKGSEAVASQAIAAGVTDYVQKGRPPEQYEVLVNRIENAVDQYRTQRQFWNALSWYRRLVEQDLAGVFVIQDGEFVYVNEKLADLFGRSQTELVGASPVDLVVNEREMDNVLDRLIEASPSEGETLRTSFDGRHADGGTLVIDCHAGGVEYEGKPAWIGILRAA
ncbi:MAG: response regulator [Salinirussus sp.]